MLVMAKNIGISRTFASKTFLVKNMVILAFFRKNIRTFYGCCHKLLQEIYRLRFRSQF
jgi:hypothetical protein